MIKWLKNKFFGEFEDETVIFKVKIKKGDQEYQTLCWMTVYGYWKYSSDFFYTSLGMIHYGQGYTGKYTPGKSEETYLKVVEQEFLRRAKQGGGKILAMNKKAVPISELLEKMDK